MSKRIPYKATCFADPYGAYDRTTMPIVTGIGFVTAVDAWGGPATFTAELDRYHPTRIDLSGFYSLSDDSGLVT